MRGVRKELVLGALAYGLVLFLTFAPSCAEAQEMPCVPEGDRVSCTRVGFDILVQKLVKSEGERKSCLIELNGAKADAADQKAALQKCLSDPPCPPPPAPVKPSALLALSPVVAGILGSALVTASVAGDFSASTRVTGAVVGLGLLSAGIVFALP